MPRISCSGTALLHADHLHRRLVAILWREAAHAHSVRNGPSHRNYTGYSDPAWHRWPILFHRTSVSSKTHVVLWHSVYSRSAYRVAPARIDQPTMFHKGPLRHVAQWLSFEKRPY